MSTSAPASRLKTAMGNLVKLAGLRPGFGGAYPVGLDLGPDRVNLVQMETQAGKPVIRALATLPCDCTHETLYQNPKILKDLLKQAYAAQAFKGKRVVSSLPAGKIKIITVAYKRTGNPAADNQAVVAELRERLQDGLDDMVVDFMTLRDAPHDSERGEALVALAPRQNVMTYLDLLVGAGLTVDALDVGPAALVRLVRHIGREQWERFPNDPNGLMINFGTTASYLTVVWGRRLILDRAIEFCEERMFTRLEKMLDLPADMARQLLYGQEFPTARTTGEARPTPAATIAEVLNPELTGLISEVRKTLGYMASKERGRSVDIIYLAGQAACYPGIRQALDDALQMRVEILNPMKVFAATGSAAPLPTELGMTPGIALATGLALRGVPENG